MGAYKTLQPGVLDPPEPSSRHRQSRVDALPGVRDVDDIISRLSDAADRKFPIFRNITVGTLILNGASGRMRVWGYGRAAASGPPTYDWNIHTFFKDVAHSSE